MFEGRAGSARSALSWSVVAVVVASALAVIGPVHASANPPLPIALDSRFVGNLSAPGLDSGTSGNLGLTLSNPLPEAVSAVELVLNLYAFNALPGNANSTLPLSAPPLLATATTTGLWANYSFVSLPSGSRTVLSVGVVTSASTPVGAYSVRTSLAFTARNGTTYRMASRGWFTEELWETATEEPNGSAVLDEQSLRTLNISGVLPETSIQVTSSTLDVALIVLLGIVFALVGVGAYFYFARSAHSKSGAR